jgi:hypothetical protein
VVRLSFENGTRGQQHPSGYGYFLAYQAKRLFLKPITASDTYAGNRDLDTLLSA